MSKRALASLSKAKWAKKGNTNSKVDKGYKIDPRFYPPDEEGYKRRVFIGNTVKYAVWALEDGKVQRFVQSPEMQQMVKRNFKERRRALISVAGRGGVGSLDRLKARPILITLRWSMTLVNARAAFEKAVTDAVAAADNTVLMVYDNVAFTTPG